MSPETQLQHWARRIAVAQGQAPADLVLANATVANVFSGELLAADIAIADGKIAGIGHYPHSLSREDLGGRVVTPSFIDAHIHLEPTHLWPPEFARAVVPHGTGAVITDPHEIANVAGLAGMESLRTATTGLPLDIRFTVPSCVPASPFESPGAELSLEEMEIALAWPETVGLGEMMNFPGVLAANDEVGKKLAAAEGRRRDGHAPGITGAALQAYAGAGPVSDHESTAIEEAREKLRAGLMVMIREGSTEQNLHELLPLVTETTATRFCFASDDRDCHNLLHRGHIDETIRLAIAAGLAPMQAIRLATWNPADYWRLENIGAVAPGYWANLVVLDNLERVEVAATMFRGEIVARQGQMVSALPAASAPAFLRSTVNIAPLQLSQLALNPDDARKAVQVIPGQIVTRLIEVEPNILGNVATSDPARDLLKLVCVERHKASGRVGVGYVEGFGLRRGALASTMAHDAHNIIAVGVDDSDILLAIATVAESQGGLAAIADGRVIAHFPLPIAGLFSDAPLDHAAADYEALEMAARDLGSSLPSPFGLLAFMALSVIPEARVTDRGFLRVGS